VSGQLQHPAVLSLVKERPVCMDRQEVTRARELVSTQWRQKFTFLPKIESRSSDPKPVTALTELSPLSCGSLFDARLVVVVHVDEVRLCLWTVATNGPIVHPQVIYEYGEPWCNEIYRIKLLIGPSQLPGNSTSSYLVAKQEEHGEGNAEFCLRSTFSHSQCSITCRKIYDLGPTAYFPSEGSRATDFYRP
jgi:hypothetical protein